MGTYETGGGGEGLEDEEKTVKDVSNQLSRLSKGIFFRRRGRERGVKTIPSICHSCTATQAGLWLWQDYDTDTSKHTTHTHRPEEEQGEWRGEGEGDFCIRVQKKLRCVLVGGGRDAGGCWRR